MLGEILNKIITVYRQYTGTGKILVLFVLCIGGIAVSYVRSGKKMPLLKYILYFPATICYAIVETVGCVSAYASDEDNRRKSLFYRIFIIVLCVFALMISGKRIFSPDFYVRAENSMHISNDLISAMDTVLADSGEEEIRVVTMPGCGEYFKAYDQRFETLYEDNAEEDTSGYDSKVREAYTELKEQYPDMRKVAAAARENGCGYVVIRNDSYWPEVPLEDTGFEKISTSGIWDVYRMAAGGGT